MREISWLVKIVAFPTCLDHAVQMSCSRNLDPLERVHLSDRQSDHASKQMGARFACGRMVGWATRIRLRSGWWWRVLGGEC